MAETFEFPETFKVTDAASLAGQRSFIQSTRVQLILLVIASAAGSLSWTINGDWDGTALLAGVAFSVAAILRLLILRSRPHRRRGADFSTNLRIKSLSPSVLTTSEEPLQVLITNRFRR